MTQASSEKYGADASFIWNFKNIIGMDFKYSKEHLAAKINLTISEGIIQHKFDP